MLNFYIRYRPLRIGWCVRAANIEHVRTAMRLNSILWGGRFNPLIPVDDEQLALQLVESFRVDALYPVDNRDSTIRAEDVPLTVEKRKAIPRNIITRSFVCCQVPCPGQDGPML